MPESRNLFITCFIGELIYTLVRLPICGLGLSCHFLKTEESNVSSVNTMNKKMYNTQLFEFISLSFLRAVGWWICFFKSKF